MFYGLPGGPCHVPDSLNMLALDDANLPAAAPKPTTPTTATAQKSRRPKNRRHRAKNVAAESTTEAGDEATAEVDGKSDRVSARDDGSTGFWASLGSSDSEFSDVEHTGSVSRGRQHGLARVRLHSLACFHTFIKVTDDRFQSISQSIGGGEFV